VEDADATAELLTELGGARRLEGLPSGPADRERTVDLLMGSFPVRLVTPLSAESTVSLDRGPRWWSVCLRVPDLDAALDGLEASGVSVMERDERHARTDPETTHGLPLEWTA
jgi:hypothetical protein